MDRCRISLRRRWNHLEVPKLQLEKDKRDLFAATHFADTILRVGATRFRTQPTWARFWISWPLVISQGKNIPEIFLRYSAR